MPYLGGAKTTSPKLLVGAGAIGIAGYYYDREFKASAIRRSLRTLWMGIVVTLDYKWNFNPANSEGIDALHERVARRLHNCVIDNGGLYIKAGQAIGLQAALLPAPYREAFNTIFDQAPSESFKVVKKTVESSLGAPIDTLFDSFDPEPVASASIAQVHRAVLNGKEVAVKPSARDHLLTLHTMTDVSDQMRHETDFIREAHNATRAAEDIAGEPKLRGRVIVPKVYWERTGDKVLTADWIGGACRITDAVSQRRWGFDPKVAMDTLADTIGAQMFVFGFLHADPHPGNVLVRPNPENPKIPQVVLIDHGLYVTLPEKFRGEYATLWRSLFIGDLETIENIAEAWGIRRGNANLFSSAILLKPHRVQKYDADQDDHGAPQDHYSQQVMLKEKMKTFLEFQDLIPRELIFVGRAQRMLQANNQSLGSPSNRLNITAHWAAAGYAQIVPPVSYGVSDTFHAFISLLVFRLALSIVDLGFWFTRLRQWLYAPSWGFEDTLDKQFRDMARNELGVEIGDDDRELILCCVSNTYFHGPINNALWFILFTPSTSIAKMVTSSVLGFPRIGAHREVKKAVEAYWAGKQTADELQKVAAEVRKTSWTSVKSHGVTYVPSGEFSLYDHVLDHSAAFNVIPPRYQGQGLSPLDIFFAMGRGRQADGVDVPASEMKKWFDSNYHYVVPEFSESTDIKLLYNKALTEYKEAKAAGIDTRPVLLGPLSFLILGKNAKEAKSGFEAISLLPKLLPVYEEILSGLKKEGAEWVQIDEPILVLDIAEKYATQFGTAYEALSKTGIKILLTTYFGRLDSNLKFVAKLPVAGLHIDLDRAPAQLDEVLAAIKDSKIVLSLGLVSGRNIWKNDFEASVKLGRKAVEALGSDRVIVATSSSLLHTPVTLANEKNLTSEQRDWFSFALEKAHEVATIAAILSDSQDNAVAAALEANRESIKKRREFERTSDDAVRKRVDAITPKDLDRKDPFPVRWEAQKKHLALPKFPTTTIGSFPQTKEIRTARANFTKGTITKAQYEEFIEKEIREVVAFQEEVGLDLLVHGEPERNDMVQYFGEQLNGFVFTQNGWVQSYGSRYVRPPIIVSDVSRPGPMTVRWSSYAQKVSKKPMKGMLTGPVTILNWSFPRADVSRELQSKQLALALRDEVIDLEKAGIHAIQVDEPAIREGLPLRRVDWDNYLKWAVDSFRLATAGVSNETQTHSHFCYSDFNDIFPSIQRLDADVISVEASKSDLKLLGAFKQFGYSNQIGPGVYDIHSPRVPSEQEIKDRITEFLTLIRPDLLFVNPDCGLKTRGWKETKASLQNLVAAARWAREQGH
ncbi:5-methyltetrahydropteroyltriglutamate homocysteine S-methyltransferase [Ceratobasidium theobromae]|uniref:5-methyltetrahydropteroyltriglutamate--homocysteine S-methyltransferase n=1 Tax=Ceratobasidium theobromae TaxID=1582974 RepID=A0A5N5QS78_9AGAM|nr:5-methyltetrahydropteroyltriglutamate homocysteine S-methyltransferase [Ceratobasidium theobromae]